MSKCFAFGHFLIAKIAYAILAIKPLCGFNYSRVYLVILLLYKLIDTRK